MRARFTKCRFSITMSSPVAVDADDDDRLASPRRPAQATTAPPSSFEHSDAYSIVIRFVGQAAQTVDMADVWIAKNRNIARQLLRRLREK